MKEFATQSIALHELPGGTCLRVGPALLEVTQIGKPEDEPDVIHKLVGDSVIPKRGILARILEGDTVRAGDTIQLIDTEARP